MIKRALLQSLIFLAILAVFSHFFTRSVLATTPTTSQRNLQIEPAYQELIIQENTTTDFFISVINNTNQAESFEVFGVEFLGNQHFGSLQFVDITTDSIKQQPGYLSFDAQQFVVDPQDAHVIKARITDRADLRPGGTYIAVIIRTVSTSVSSNQKVLPAFASTVLLRKKSGEIQNLSLIDVRDSKRLFRVSLPTEATATFQNNGNVHLIPHGEITLTDLFGRVIKQATLNEDSAYVLPGTQREISNHLRNTSWSLPISLLSLKIIGSSEATSYSVEYSFIYVSPVLLVFIFLGFILLTLRYKLSQRKA